jgi:hypothetical protein
MVKENGDTVREDLGYRGNTQGDIPRYQIQKDLRMPQEQGESPHKSDLCRVRYNFGDMAGQEKKIAWEYAEPLIKSRRVVFIKWI